jgi:hypothetical protein
MITREQTTPRIDNTQMWKLFNDGNHIGYAIQAVEGYELHDNSFDSIDPTGEKKMVFKDTESTVGTGYDFDNVRQATVFGQPVQMVGEYEFFAIETSIVGG